MSVDSPAPILRTSTRDTNGLPKDPVSACTPVHVLRTNRPVDGASRRGASTEAGTEKLPVRLGTLRFTDDALEAAFAESSAEQARGPVRLALLLGCVLYALFGTLDPWMVPEAAGAIWVIRSGVCLFLLFTYAITFRATFGRYLQAWLSLIVLVTAAGVLAMVLLARETGGYTYYAGLMLVVAYAHGLLRIRFAYAVLTSLLILAAYEAIAIGLKSTPVHLVVNNTFFLATAMLMCVWASYALEFYTRKVFWQTCMLDANRRALEAEHTRKTGELEAARRLQLAMLPGCVPDHPDLDLAVLMWPATEVGGDYYDFDLADDGSLTLVIGDATGHGAQAGTMVTATKILFAGLSDERDILVLLRKANRTLRRTGLSRVYMALALGQYRDGALDLVGAGMPPALVYRAASKRVEQVPLKGMPLGSVSDFPYRKTRIELAPGDAVLLMSDGFPEAFNPDGEMLGYDRAVSVFGEAAHRSPAEIIGHVEQTIRRWTAARAPADDVTLLAFRVKPGAV